MELAESQRRSFELFDLAPVGYLTLDVRGNIMAANLMVSHLLDVPRKQLVGMPFLGFVPMKARNAFTDYMKRARVAETGQDMELALKKGAGGETEVQIRCVSMWDGKEVSEGMRVIIIDISKRKAAERALRWREEQSNQILNAMLDLICYCDEDMHVLWANNSFLRMVGRRLHEVAGSFCYGLLYGRDVPCDECRGMQALKKGVTQPFVPAMAPRGADAQNTHWECCIVPLADPSGPAIFFSSAGMDQASLNSDVAIGLYRLVQEGIRNIRKHAHASRVQVRMIAGFPNIHLFIEDNGVGFDVEERRRKTSKEKRMGLRSMEERVQLLRGTFVLHYFRYDSKCSISDLVFKGFDVSELKDLIQLNLDDKNICAARFENAPCLWRNEWVAPGKGSLFDRRRRDADPVM